MFAREGYPFIIGAAALAALLFAAALRTRSWPLWLTAFFVTVIALWVAWFFREPVRVGERGPYVAIPTLRVAVGQRTQAGVTVVAQRPNT